MLQVFEHPYGSELKVLDWDHAVLGLQMLLVLGAAWWDCLHRRCGCLSGVVEGQVCFSSCSDCFKVGRSQTRVRCFQHAACLVHMVWALLKGLKGGSHTRGTDMQWQAAG